MESAAKSMFTLVRLALTVILMTGCYVEWDDSVEEEVVGGGRSSTDALFDQGISMNPMRDSRAFGFELNLPDSLKKEGWGLKGYIKTRMATWSGYKQQLKVRERFTLTISNSSYRFGIGKLVVTVYDADPSWKSAIEMTKTLGRNFDCEDRIIGGYAAVTFKASHASPVPIFPFFVFLNQPYFYRILIRGDVPDLGVDFDRLLKTFQLYPPRIK